MMLLLVLVALLGFCGTGTAEDVWSLTVCEGHSLILYCPGGYHYEIISAVYGRRDNMTCYRGDAVETSRMCANENVIQSIEDQCDLKNPCIMMVNDAFEALEGDPCEDESVHIYKYLEIKYQCAEDVIIEPTTVKILEDRFDTGTTTAATTLDEINEIDSGDGGN